MSTPGPISESPTQSPIHVLYIIDQLCELGGAERMLLSILRSLPKDRFRCSLLTFRINPELNVFANFPCAYEVLPLRRTYDWTGLQVARKIRRRIRDQRVSIVHTFFETSDLWAAPLAKMSGCKAVVSSRRDMGILRTRMHHLAYRLLNPTFDLVLTVSEAVRQFCIENDHLSPQKVMTVYNGLALDKIASKNGAGELRAQLGLAPSARLVTTIGHIRRVKGIDTLVEAAAKVLHQFPNTMFLVVGRNSEPAHFREIQERITALGIERNVRFLGETENIFPILKISDVFFLPSRSEGFSNALIEAMACGLPCVASRVGGNPEAVEDGRSGYLVACENADESAERILMLLRNPLEATRMGAAGREIVERKFTADVMMRTLTDSYEKLVAEK
jgi:L-malate glycosyltransferase